MDFSLLLYGFQADFFVSVVSWPCVLCLLKNQDINIKEWNLKKGPKFHLSITESYHHFFVTHHLALLKSNNDTDSSTVAIPLLEIPPN
jgi:hypothetical protein